MAGVIGITRTGLVTSVGLTAPSACAAMRARLANPTTTDFVSAGEAVLAHCIPLPRGVRGRRKHVVMAAMAIQECLVGIEPAEWERIPLLLCVAERDRRGRLDGLERDLIDSLEQEVGARFGADSAVVPEGRVATAMALLLARRLIAEGHRQVLIAAVDSYVNWPTLAAMLAADRLLTSRNSNGFMPGEGAGALLVEPDDGGDVRCGGLGFAREPAHIDSDTPLRGEGLALAIGAALAESGSTLEQIDFRVGDMSGEQYYFKEASLAISRLLRKPKERFDLWHPADCIGETGAVAGIASIVMASVACRKGYAPGARFIAHMATDDGRRAACVFQCGVG